MRGVTPREETVQKQLIDSGYEFFKYRELGANKMAAHTHMHDAIECIYMIEGSARIYIDGSEEVILPGDFCLFRSRGVHSIYTEDQPKNLYYVLKISLQLLHNVTPLALNGSFPLRFSVFNPELKFLWRKSELSGSIIQKNIDALIKELESPSVLPDITKIVCALSILSEVYKQTEKDFNILQLYSNQITKAVIYINEHFEDDIKEEEVAVQFGMSYGYFSRSFKAATGKNFRDYLIATRLAQAEQLIINTNAPIAEIAGKCGYDNVSHFIHIYRKMKGITPLKARKKKKSEV